jgi:hypothetical protein
VITDPIFWAIAVMYSAAIAVVAATTDWKNPRWRKRK